MMTSLEQQNIHLMETNRKLMEELSERDALISRLQDTILWLRKKVFGKMSEKHLPLDPAQLLLFDQEEICAEEKSRLEAESRQAEEEITKTITVKAKPSRKPLDLSKLPVQTEDIYPEGTTDGEGHLLEGYVEIGTEETTRLEAIPAKAYIVKTIRHKIISKSDLKEKFPEERDILCPALPLVPVPKCIAGASVLTDIIIGKFMYHLPFHRIIQQYKEAGITISDSTMGGWYESVLERLKLLYDLLRKKVMSSQYVQIDESVVPVIDNEKHKARKGYMWCVRDAMEGYVMFYYDMGSRGYDIARKLLGTYTGMAQSDGYEAYDQFEGRKGITMYGCWAHARRKFVDALDENRAKATEAICYIRRLYKVESDADEASLTPEERKDLRLKESYPAIRAFEEWMKATYPTVLPKSRLGKAIAYTYALLPRLSRYVNDGRVMIDNNLIENAIRPLALGRKNYLFCGNNASAYRAAIVYSLIASCKAMGVEPRKWMEDVLKDIPYYQRDGLNMAELLPGEWKKSHNS